MGFFFFKESLSSAEGFLDKKIAISTGFIRSYFYWQLTTIICYLRVNTQYERRQTLISLLLYRLLRCASKMNSNWTDYNLCRCDVDIKWFCSFEGDLLAKIFNHSGTNCLCRVFQQNLLYVKPDFFKNLKTPSPFQKKIYIINSWVYADVNKHTFSRT